MITIVGESLAMFHSRPHSPRSIGRLLYCKFAARRSWSSRSPPTVAVLFQSIDPPIVNGVCKPRKPGGYQDSGADIAYALLQTKEVNVVTPTRSPHPAMDEGWCFPDTEEGIYSAVRQGATHLWANTILFASHPIQTSSLLQPCEAHLHVVGQPPGLVENFDDKAYLNGKLRDIGAFTLPRSWLVSESQGLSMALQSITHYPVVGKPIRGRGSHGVKVCYSPAELEAHVRALFSESPIVMLEEFLAGEEVTITVMPPTAEHPEYWSLPPVARFNHIDGVAPYNGVMAVTKNSRVVTSREMQDPSYKTIMRQCEQVTKLIRATAPIRVDVRRPKEGAPFVLFDVNMKPNMTGPGRPGREDQASLTAMAATAIGWDYSSLLENILYNGRMPNPGTFHALNSIPDDQSSLEMLNEETRRILDGFQLQRYHVR